jgi:hypothetical protein
MLPPISTTVSFWPRNSICFTAGAMKDILELVLLLALLAPPRNIGTVESYPPRAVIESGAPDPLALRPPSHLDEAITQECWAIV